MDDDLIGFNGCLSVGNNNFVGWCLFVNCDVVLGDF